MGIFDPYRRTIVHAPDLDEWDPDDATPPTPFDREPARLPEHWAANSLFGTGRHVVIAEGTDHWSGGPPMHEGARCPLCSEPYLMVLDLNLNASEVPAYLVNEFAPLTRLPLYYCPRCEPGTIYRVISDDVVHAIHPLFVEEGYDYRTAMDETPFKAAGFPQLARRELQLNPIPSEIHRCMVDIWQARCGVDVRLSADDKAKSLRWLGVNDEYDLPVSQIGGVPLFTQGHEPRRCWLPPCPLSFENTDIRDDEDKPMDIGVLPLAFLTAAAIPELGIGSAVKFEVCWGCLTVYANYEVS